MKKGVYEILKIKDFINLKMLETFFGLIAGIISGTGMGGGAILILLCTIFLKMDHHLIQAANLIFFIPTSIVAIFVNTKNKNLDFKYAIPIIFSGILGAVIGANISSKIKSENLKKYFGYFLIFVAIYEIYSFYKLYILDKKKE